MTVKNIFWLSFSIMTQVMRSVKDAFPSDGNEHQISRAHRDWSAVQRAASAVPDRRKINPFVLKCVSISSLKTGAYIQQLRERKKQTGN